MGLFRFEPATYVHKTLGALPERDPGVESAGTECWRNLPAIPSADLSAIALFPSQPESLGLELYGSQVSGQVWAGGFGRRDNEAAIING